MAECERVHAPDHLTDAQLDAGLLGGLHRKGHRGSTGWCGRKGGGDEGVRLAAVSFLLCMAAASAGVAWEPLLLPLPAPQDLTIEKQASRSARVRVETRTPAQQGLAVVRGGLQAASRSANWHAGRDLTSFGALDGPP